MTLKQKQEKKNSKKKKIPNWAVALITTFGIIFYFTLGSWQLSFAIDQIKCRNKEPTCMLPSNPYGIPYRPNTAETAGLGDIFEKAKSAGENWTVLEILKKIFSIVPKKPKTPMRGGNSEKSPKRVNNFTTTVDIDGFRPFDIYNGPPGWPYDLADEPSNWQTGYFSQWFGNMQITAWSTVRGFLYGYLSLFNSLADNMISRFFLTWWMPIIISLALIFQPLISFITCIWANLSAGVAPWGVVFFFVPIITIVTMFIQHIQLVGYVIVGGIVGSGASNVSKNLSLDMKKGYGRIMQAIMAIGLIITLILFIVDKTKKTK